MGYKGLVLLALAALLSGCLKDDPQEGTIVLMGTESYVDSIKGVIHDTTLLKVLTDTSLMQMSLADLPKGNMPPDVQGEFVLSPKELIYYNNYPVMDGDSICFRFGGDGNDSGFYPNGQHNRVTPCDYEENGMLGHVDVAYLMGSGNAFTAYFELTYEHIDEIPGVDYDMTRGYVIIGEMSRDGEAINNARVAYVNIAMKVNYNNIAVSGVHNAFIEAMEGYVFVYKGTVLRRKWYHNRSEL